MAAQQRRKNEDGVFAQEDWTQHNTRSQILFFFFPERGKYYVCKRWPECWLLWKPQLSIQWLRPSIAIYTMLLTTAQELHLRNRELWYQTNVFFPPVTSSDLFK